MADQIKLSVPGKPDYVGTVRIAAAHIASKAGFDIEAIEDIKVAISEACTNIVLHSHETEDFAYDIEIELDVSGLAVTVKDNGVGFGMEDYIEPVPGETNGSGLGIFIIRALMDEVEINTEPGHGTSIRMIKYRQSEAS